MVRVGSYVPQCSMCGSQKIMSITMDSRTDGKLGTTTAVEVIDLEPSMSELPTCQYCHEFRNPFEYDE